MIYKIEIKPKAIKDGKKIPRNILKRIFEKIEILQNDLEGDVKHLTNFTPEYRLRVGSYRILFEIENNQIKIYRIMHRKEVYKQEIIMLALNPNILEKNGVKEFAVLPFEEFLNIKEELQSYEDLKHLKEAKELESSVVGIKLDEAKKEWGI